MGRVGGGDVMTAFMHGLDQPQVRGQFTPCRCWVPQATRGLHELVDDREDLVRHVSGPGVTTADAVLPTDTVMLVPSATSM